MDIVNTPKYWCVKNNGLILTVLLIIFCNVPFAAAEGKILSIQSIKITPYEEAFNGFQSLCNMPIDRLVISEMKDKNIVKEIRKINPSMILSIGVDALDKIKDINDIPIIYLMVPSPKFVIGKDNNLTGIRMNISQEKQLSIFLKAAPSMKTIGLLYNSEKSNYLAQRVMDACKKAGINLMAKDIKDSRDAPAAIEEMDGRLNGFWMLPDASVFTPETIEYLFLFSMKNKVPILTFSEIYLESGALISIGVDPYDMGAQAGEMALELLYGKSVTAIQPVDARKEVMSINLKVSGKLGVSIDETAFKDVRFLK
jgi:putative tryptophan/tyrosine transport system substrate-binding protein